MRNLLPITLFVVLSPVATAQVGGSILEPDWETVDPSTGFFALIQTTAFETEYYPFYPFNPWTTEVAQPLQYTLRLRDPITGQNIPELGGSPILIHGTSGFMGFDAIFVPPWDPIYEGAQLELEVAAPGDPTNRTTVEIKTLNVANPYEDPM